MQMAHTSEEGWAKRSMCQLLKGMERWCQSPYAMAKIRTPREV